MHTFSAPILVLDSGLGGLTVVKALRQVLPNENLVYFGDTARLPYGSKSKATVTAFTRQIIAYLRPLQPKHVVIACNTATALALPEVRSLFPELKISGVIEPGARAAIDAAGAKQIPIIAIIATEATAKSKAYEHAIHRRRQLSRLIVRATPLLVPIIEDGRAEDDPLVRLALTQYLKPIIDRGPDVLVLGCTHYPLVKNLITQMVGPGCRVIDSAEQCAHDVARQLRAQGSTRNSSDAGSLRCFVTDDSPRFQTLASRFLAFPIDRPTLVSTDELMADLSSVFSARQIA